jgi:hypothetical protein
MSRRLGWLQRSVLEVLEAEDRRMDTYEITRTVHGIPRGQPIWGLTDAQRAAVRRALASLAKQGQAVPFGRAGHDFGYDFYQGSARYKYWANARFGAQEMARIEADWARYAAARALRETASNP